MRRSTLFVLLAGVSAFSSSVAMAQTAAADAADAAGAPQEEIIVTGSRVTTGANTPTPVTVLPTEQFLKLQPGTVTDAINLLPAVQGVFSGTSARPGGAQRNGAGAYITLRNMGNLRTLVLYDGLRLVPTINQNQADVDSSIVPQLLLKRVDVVTGGVSAVYGSDAISGVVNFITDRDFNGVKLQASNGISQYGDGRIWDVGGAFGTKFADDRGHFEFAYQHREDDGVISRLNSGRPFYENLTGAGGNGTTVPYFNFDNQRISNMTYGGLIVNAAGNGNLRDLMFTSNGTLTPFVHGLIPTSAGLVQGTTANAATAVPTNVESGGSGVYNQFTSLKAASKLNQAFGRLDYALTDDVHAYVQGSYTNLHTYVNYQSPNFTNLRVSLANPYLDSALSTANLTAAGLTAAQITATQALRSNQNNVVTFGRFLLKEPRADQFTESFIGNAGLDGSLGSYKWDLGVSYSQSKIRAVNQINIDNGRLFAALDAVRNGSGQIVCRAAATNANYAGCVPLNLFGEGQASDAALNYIFRQTNSWNTTRQLLVNGGINGSPASTWAGPITVALSGEYRRLTWKVDSDATPNDLADCSGIGTGVTGGLNCTQGRTLQWFFNAMGRLPQVAQQVGEGAIEANVPLLDGKPFFKHLDLTGAVRFTHYDTSGNATTWKVGLDWQVNDDIRLRATRSRDIRAPNLFELYSPVQRNPNITINNDPTGFTPNGTVVVNTQAANPNLTPEKADTLTVGAVLKPSFVPGFTATVDFYRIKVQDAINLLQGFSQQVLTLCNASNAPSFCSQFVTRDATTKAVTATYSTYLNIASFETWGIDTELAYKTQLLGQNLDLRTMIAYQPKLTFDQGPAGVLEAAGFFNTGSNRIGASPKWRVTAIAAYDVTDTFSVSLLERWRSGMQANANTALLVRNANLPAYATTNVNLSWRPKSDKADFEFYVNVSNVFNKFPTVYYTGTSTGLNQGLPEGDDVMGRYFNAGVRLKF